MGEVRVRRLEPVHDAEAYDRVMRILGNGLRRGLLRLRREDSHSDHAPKRHEDSPT